MSLPIRIPDLLPRIQELAPSAPGEKELWVLLPSFALVRELGQSLVEEGGSYAGLRLMSADMAVQHLLELHGIRPGEVVPSLAQAELLHQVLKDLDPTALPEGEARELGWLLRFPETQHGLLRALTQLRNHGWPGAPLQPLVSDRGRLMGRILTRFAEKLQAGGLLDRRALLEQALATLGTANEQDPAQVLIFAPGPRLSGELEALLQGFEERGIPVEVLSEAPLPDQDDTLEARALHLAERGDTGHEALSHDCFAMFTAQGELEEMREALQRARQLVREGCPPHRIALVLADTQPYARHIGRLAREEGLPLEPGLGRTLDEQPMAALALRLIRLLSEDLPRKDLLACLGDPCFTYPECGFLLHRENLAWLDRVSREDACLGGRQMFAELLDRRCESLRKRRPGSEELERAERIRDDLDVLLGALEQSAELIVQAPTHAARCAELGALLTRCLRADDEESLARRQAILDRLDQLQWRDRLDLPLLDLADFSDDCADILREESARHPSFRAGGIRILSLDRFRGLQVDHVFLLGFNRGRFPRKTQDDLWLTDADRTALRESFYGDQRIVQPGLFPAFEVAEESREIQLQDLATLLGGAAKSFTLSWLRADAAGRQKSPAAWLRLFGRALAGTDLEDELREDGWIQPLPWSPLRRLRHRLDNERPLSTNEALTLAAFEGGDASLLETASLIGDERMEGLQRAGSERQRIDAFAVGKDPDALAWDALALGRPARVDESLPVTAIESLGRCPFQFYLRTLLQARPLPEEPLLDGIRMLDLGSALHDVLNKLFAFAKQEGLLDGELEPAFEQMQGRITLETDHQQKRLLSQLARRLPAVKQEYLQSWRRSLEELLARDLAELLESGYRPEAFEEKIGADITIGGGRVEERRVHLHGRMDRLDRHADGRQRVLDYKSGGSYKPEPEEIKLQPFRGQYLQLPLYMLLLRELSAEALPEAELRGIAPDALATCKGALPRKTFSAFLLENEAGLRESLGILHELAIQGNFPFHKARHCSYCDYRHGCPRLHRPSQERQESWPALDDYRDMLGKRTKTILLGERDAGGKP